MEKLKTNIKTNRALHGSMWMLYFAFLFFCYGAAI